MSHRYVFGLKVCAASFCRRAAIWECTKTGRRFCYRHPCKGCA